MGWEIHRVVAAADRGLHHYIACLKRVRRARNRLQRAAKKGHVPTPQPAPKQRTPRRKPSPKQPKPGYQGRSPLKVASALTPDQSYKILGTTPADALPLQRQAYLRGMKQHHPDRVFTCSPAEKTHAEAYSVSLNLAWEIVEAAHT